MCQLLVFVSVVLVLAAGLLWIMRRALFQPVSLRNLEFGFKCIIALAVANIFVGTATITLMVMVNSEANLLETHRAKYQPKLESVLRTLDDIASADIKIINGRIPDLVAQFSSFNFKSLAQIIYDDSVKLFQAAYFQSPRNFDLATGAGAVESVVSNIISGLSLDQSNNSKTEIIGDDMTGQGGLLLEVLNYGTTWLQKNTNVTSWKYAAEGCLAVVNKLAPVYWGNQYHCPLPWNPREMCDWDANDSVTTVLNTIKAQCATISKLSS